MKTEISKLNTNTKLWVVGEVKNQKTKAWEIIGIYSTEKLAVSKCNKDRFVGPIILDGKASYKTQVWKGAYYPKLRIQLSTKKNGYRDYDINGYGDIRRACVPFKIALGDIFNIYRGKSKKEGCIWLGTLEYSLESHINQ